MLFLPTVSPGHRVQVSVERRRSSSSRVEAVRLGNGRFRCIGRVSRRFSKRAFFILYNRRGSSASRVWSFVSTLIRRTVRACISIRKSNEIAFSETLDPTIFLNRFQDCVLTGVLLETRERRARKPVLVTQRVRHDHSYVSYGNRFRRALCPLTTFIFS